MANEAEVFGGDDGRGAGRLEGRGVAGLVARAVVVGDGDAAAPHHRRANGQLRVGVRVALVLVGAFARRVDGRALVERGPRQ